MSSISGDGAFQIRFQLVMSNLADHIRRGFQHAVCVFNIFQHFSYFINSAAATWQKVA